MHMRKWITASLVVLSACASSALAQDTIWNSSATPSIVDQNDPTGAVNLGVRFQASVAGTITGIRFYKASTNTGTHVGTLYSDTGTQLAQATFSGESASGWQQVTFTAVSISANTTYVAAYHTTNGHYSANSSYFTSAYVNSPLTALADNPSGDRNGVYLYGSSVAFPTQTYSESNYWVDVVFNPTSSSKDTIWSSSTVPGTVDSGDGTAVNLGVRFQADEAGTITGIRFYKASTNTGTHVGTLYSDTGTQLAQATFSGETGTGWQQVTFNAVSINANTTYVAAYHTTVGHYSDNNNYFTSAYVNSPLTALADNPSGDRNSVYTYSSSVVFPTSTYEACNYWVDVVFNPASGGSAPATPTNLQGTAVSSSQINLTWNASSGATGYYVYRNGTQVGSPTTNSYSDTGLAASTQYSYYVAAYNSYGTSGNSSTIQVTTQSGGSGSLPPQLQNFFPVGPYDQPNTTMAAWASRNANTLNAFGDSSETLAQWDAAAAAAGLKYIRAPDSPATNDIGNTNLLAWDQGDEDEANGVTAATAVAQYNTWKGIDPNRLVFINFSGGYLLQLQGSCNASCYAAYLPAGDWLASDVYPVAGWDSPANIVAPANWVGESVATLLSWAPTKPIFQIMESSEQNLSWCPQCPAPTPAQFHAEFWDAIVNGARGVFTFPLAISPFVWDNTTAAMDTQITADYATTNALASVLQTTINPSGMSATVTAPLEACWRDSTHQYFIVVNTDSVAHNSETITLTGTGSATSAVVYGESRNVNIVSGKITDNFAADTVHIYQVN